MTIYIKYMTIFDEKQQQHTKILSAPQETLLKFLFHYPFFKDLFLMFYAFI